MMPAAAEVINTSNVFAIDEDFKQKPEVHDVVNDTVEEKSPSSFLNGLTGSGAENLTAKPEAMSTSQNETSSSSQPFAPVSSMSTFSMNSISAANSPMAQNIANQMKDRMNNIKPWKDFFALDQFGMPQSTTAAQSRVSHNINHFQNNYLMFVLLLTAFSL